MKEVVEDRMHEAWAWKKMNEGRWSRRAGLNEDGRTWEERSGKEHVDTHMEPPPPPAPRCLFLTYRGTCSGESGWSWSTP